MCSPDRADEEKNDGGKGKTRKYLEKGFKSHQWVSWPDFLRKLKAEPELQMFWPF